MIPSGVWSNQHNFINRNKVQHKLLIVSLLSFSLMSFWIHSTPMLIYIKQHEIRFWRRRSRSARRRTTWARAPSSTSGSAAWPSSTTCSTRSRCRRWRPCSASSQRPSRARSRCACSSNWVSTHSFLKVVRSTFVLIVFSFYSYFRILYSRCIEIWLMLHDSLQFSKIYFCVRILYDCAFPVSISFVLW